MTRLLSIFVMLVITAAALGFYLQGNIEAGSILLFCVAITLLTVIAIEREDNR